MIFSVPIENELALQVKRLVDAYCTRVRNESLLTQDLRAWFSACKPFVNVLQRQGTKMALQFEKQFIKLSKDNGSVIDSVDLDADDDDADPDGIDGRFQDISDSIDELLKDDD